ncbi:uncharacterized protein LOC126190752 [Schistocerca cancellata]|uniref:uncharacterized protein LOC126190752 n=1 Tax=Schistocerca cancellata TaxID=274614 RepID=UPI0021192E4C|nr:uncharacterized protein LOC126190752 [Schistocerca cancellata]
MSVSCCRVHRCSIWGLLAILTAIAGAVVLPRPPPGAEPRSRRDIRAATVEPRSHVTSSELPKQIPAPPSRTVMQHRPTPALIQLQLRWEDRQRPSVTLPPRLFTPTVQRYTHRTDLLPNSV